MIVNEVVAELEAQGVELWVEGDALRFRAPKGALTPEMRAYLKENREVVKQAIRERAWHVVTTYPMAYSQLSMWLVHQSAPDSAAYHVAFAMRIKSQVDVAALHKAFQTLVDRHAALRTTYMLRDDGQPIQRVAGYVEVNFRQTNVAGLDEEQLHQQIQLNQVEPFDLAKGPVNRVRLFTHSPENHVLLVVIHHIAVDGLSMWVLINEMQALYAAYAKGESLLLPYPEVTPGDFAEWQAEMLAGPVGEQGWSYWEQQLAGEIPPLDLPTDRPRPPVMTYRGGTVGFDLNADITQGLKSLGKTEGVTLYRVLLAAFQVLLHRYTSQDDVVVGTPTLGRNPQFGNVVGDFVNMVPMRVNLADNPPFRHFLAQVQQVVQAALENQDFPFPLMVERLGRRQDTSHSPLFQVSFDLQYVRQTDQASSELPSMYIPHKASPAIELGGLRIEVYPLSQQEGQFDLVLQMLDQGETLSGVLKYSSDIFDRTTVERIIGHFEQLLAGIVENPDQPVSDLPLLTDSERQQLLVDWNQTVRDYAADTGVHQLFERQTAQTPAALAVIFGEQTLTYADLNIRANQLAHYLRERDVKPGTLVGVHVERGLNLMVALLGVLKAGAAYVPMDPAFPKERLGYMIEDAGMPVIISQANLARQLPPHTAEVVQIDHDWSQIQQQPTKNQDEITTGDDLAYVIFTSGSTGRPKGVQIEHHSLTNFLMTMLERPGLKSDDVMLNLTTLSFDIAALEIYLPLIVGASVVMLSRDATWDGRQIAAILEHQQVTVMQATPASWQLLLESGWQGKPGLRMFCGGEALSPHLAGRLLECGAELWNLYGPTETTIWSTVERITTADETIAIGRPIANTTIYILDSRLQPVPVGVAGSLYIGGEGVARGYIQRPDLTAERFIINPFSDGRIYNTGDLARWLPNGRVECLGRVDHQVKIRGFRIELGEIEAALDDHPDVQKAVVIVREDQADNKRLVAYVVGGDGKKPESGTLRDYLAARLPDYMVPAVVVALDAFPLTPNNKIDRRALPVPENLEGQTRRTVTEAHTPAEALLVGVWRRVLGVKRVSVLDNFFDLGGHSLQVVQVISELEKETGVRLEPAVMRYQSLRQQAATIEAAGPLQVVHGVAAVPETSPIQIQLADRLEEPFFFGAEQSLFGVYYPPADTGQQIGVVVCHPWGQEYIRAHRACHQLALRLSNLGVPALRFDYYGTGDSAGEDEEASVQRSLESIATAIEELRTRSGVTRIALVGMRLGATLAALAGPQHPDVERVVLWEPLVNGAEYLEELKAWHSRNMLYFLGNIKDSGPKTVTEILGFALSQQMVSEIGAINLLGNTVKPADQVMVIEREKLATTTELCQHLKDGGAAVAYHQVDAPQMWTENPDKALVPHQTLETIVNWMMEG